MPALAHGQGTEVISETLLALAGYSLMVGTSMSSAEQNLNVRKLNMKRLLSVAVGTVALCTAMSIARGVEELLPGQVDFGAFAAPKGSGEFVEVNLPSSLIALGARLAQKEDPEVARLLEGLRLVHVNVIGLEEANRAEIQKRAQKIRKDLVGKGWEQIVIAQKQEKDVGVYLKMAEKHVVQGLVALATDGSDHAIFVNIVGDIKPEQLELLGDKLHLDPLKKIGRAGAASENKETTPEKDEK